MPRLSSGFIIAGAYADKIRRTAFAQLRDYIRRDKEWASKIAFAVAQLNRLLYTILVEQLRVDKGDVVRIRINYDIDEARKDLVWRWDTLSIEAFRRLPPEQVERVVKEAIEKAAEIVVAVVNYSVSKLGETPDGDVVYAVTLGEKEVGAVIVTPVNDALCLLKRGAVMEPTPAVFERVKLETVGKTLEDAIKEVLAKVIQSARHVSYDEALKMVNVIRERVAAAPMPKYEEVEEE